MSKYCPKADFDVLNAKRVFTGLWIGFLYIVCMLLVIYSLSTYQFQMGLNSIPKNKPDTATKFIDHECDISGLKDKLMDKSLIKIPCIPNNTQIESDFYSTGEVLSIYKTFNDVIKSQITLEYERRHKLLIKINDMERDINNKPEDEALVWLKKGAIGNVRAINLNIVSLEKQQSEFMLNHKNLVETFSDIQYFENLFNVFSSIFKLNSFWALPKQILTIILILSMGILGSLIFVTIEFLKDSECHTNMRCSMYIFRPFLGMIVALAMYVMVKSGQSTFADTSSEMLSPFMISFLGIISGMLAEQAYQRLAIAGSSVINGSKVENNESIKPKED